MRRTLLLFILLAGSLAAGAVRTDSLTLEIGRRIDSVRNGYAQFLERSQLGLSVYDLTADTAVYACGSRQHLRPASTQKLFTAVCALSLLGGDYQYTTTLLALPADTLRADTLASAPPPANHWHGSLAVRGGMDPQFGRQDLQTFVSAVRGLGADTLDGDLILDLSMKDGLRLGWGWCWDDDDRPLTPLTYQGRDDFARAFTDALAAAGIVLTGQVRESLSPVKGHTLSQTRVSIDRILQRMMKRSDNQYAESLFYQMGPSRQKVAQRMLSVLRSAGVDMEGNEVADGSGLSLYNYTTPASLVALLRHAYRTPPLYRHLQPALPLAGYDGTLSKRMTGGPACRNVMAKTGTLTGVSTLAGYALAANGHMLAFAIMNQGISSSGEAHRFQDAVCQALCRPLVCTPAADLPDPAQDPMPLPDESEEQLTAPL